MFSGLSGTPWRLRALYYSETQKLPEHKPPIAAAPLDVFSGFREALQRAPGFDDKLREELLGVLSNMQGQKSDVPDVNSERAVVQDAELVGEASSSMMAGLPLGDGSRSQPAGSEYTDNGTWPLGSCTQVDIRSMSPAPGSPTQSDIEDALDLMPTPEKYTGTKSFAVPTPLRSRSLNGTMVVYQPDDVKQLSARRSMQKSQEAGAANVTPPCKSAGNVAEVFGAETTPENITAVPRRYSLANARNRFKRSIGASGRSGEFRSTILRELDSICMSPIQCKEHKIPSF